MAENRYRMSGEVDLSTAPLVRSELARLISADDAHLLIDCAQLTFIDSTGVAVLLEANQKLEAGGRHLLLLNVQRGPRRVLETLGLSDLLRFEREPA
jgi:anti-sigma B factor antagonist